VPTTFNIYVREISAAKQTLLESLYNSFIKYSDELLFKHYAQNREI